MPHLSLLDCIKVINEFNGLPNGTKSKYCTVSRQVKPFIKFLFSESSESGVRRLVEKWINTSQLTDRPKLNVSKCVISKEGQLALNKALLKIHF